MRELQYCRSASSTSAHVSQFPQTTRQLPRSASFIIKRSVSRLFSPFFEKVAVDDELVCVRKAYFLKKPSEIGHVCVYIRNGDDTPITRVKLLHTRALMFHIDIAYSKISFP